MKSELSAASEIVSQVIEILSLEMLDNIHIVMLALWRQLSLKTDVITLNLHEMSRRSCR